MHMGHKIVKNIIGKDVHSKNNDNTIKLAISGYVKDENKIINYLKRKGVKVTKKSYDNDKYGDKIVEVKFLGPKSMIMDSSHPGEGIYYD